MSGYFALVILILGMFLFWFGFEVGSGRHKASPADRFFPLFGRNVDYVLGTAGTLAGVGMFILAFGIWASLLLLNYIAFGFIVAGVVRAYLPPENFGPRWYRRKFHQKTRGRKSKKRG